MKHLYSIDCESYGVAFRLCSDSENVLTKMLAHAPLETGRRTSVEKPPIQFTIEAGHRRFTLSAGEQFIVAGKELDVVMSHLSQKLMIYVANLAPSRVFVHAGVVAWRSKALLLPGTSFAGKSTLVAELVRAGATYYSDEYAVLDEQGLVHPYARDLQMRVLGTTQQRSVPVTDLNGVAGFDPIPVAVVAFTEYREGADWKADPITGGMAVLEMLRHSIPVRRAPAHVMAVLARTMERAVAIRSLRGQAPKAARALLWVLQS